MNEPSISTSVSTFKSRGRSAATDFVPVSTSIATSWAACVLNHKIRSPRHPMQLYSHHPRVPRKLQILSMQCSEVVYIVRRGSYRLPALLLKIARGFLLAHIDY